MQARSRKKKWLRTAAAVGSLTLSASAHAATFNVNDPTDAVDLSPGDGVCMSRTEGCTLRAAVMESNAIPGHDTIQIAPGVYELVLSDPSNGGVNAGDLDIHDSVDLIGGTVNQVIVDAGDRSRVFEIHEGVAQVTMHGFTIQEGNALEEPETDPVHLGQSGGGIRAFGEELILDGMLITRNYALDGGGIAHLGRLEVRHSRIHQNTANDGGGIVTYGGGGELLFTESVLWGNQAVYIGNYGSPRGGGYLSFGSAHFDRSSVVYNTSGQDGGGLYFEETNGEYSLENVTISHNQVGRAGGGIYSWPSYSARNVTVTENFAQQYGGGVATYGYNFGEYGQLARFERSIVSGNVAASLADCDKNTQSDGHSLFGPANGCPVTTAPTDLPQGVSAELGAMQFNHTHFHPLLWTSPAIDNGSASCPAVDQRGVARPQGNACDIGAYESEKDPDAPIAFDDAYSIATIGPVSIPAPGVLANDVDPNGATLTAVFVGNDTSQGTVTLQPGGGFLFTPGSFAVNTRQFTYRASNGALESNNAIVSVTSGHRYEPEVLFEVPEIPWLDPGPYHHECIAIWDDGTIGAQTFGAGRWTRSDIRGGRGSKSRGTTDFESTLTSPDGTRVSLQGTWSEDALVATATTADGKRIRVEGAANANCNAIAEETQR